MKGKKVRQLAAVMFTDIVGYSAIMQKDEELASNVRAKHRKVFDQLHVNYHGEIIQYYGDGTLSIFKSAIEASLCAIEIQRLLQEGDVVPLKIGLHMGDIVIDDTEIYGDGVNVAARIESMCISGSILVSDKINDELKNHKGISTLSMGSFELKNIDKPMEVFAVSNKGIQVPHPSELKGKQKFISKTIAVLPFVNMSSNNENEHFSDGITEEIINALAKIEQLKVTSRTSSFAFKGKNEAITAIGKKLNVSTILEGSVRLAGDALRITAQLIEVEQDYHFWSETWDRKLENIFEIQDEISLIIADKLREQFGHLEIQDHLVDKQTESIDAYALSLKAKFYRNKWNPEDVKTAISLYEKALTLDPNHSESHIGLADSYSFLGTTGFMPFEEAWGKTIQYTKQALALNSKSSGVHYQLSNQAFFIDSDYNKSLVEMKKAIELNPNNSDAHQFISFLYILAGEKEKSSNHLNISLSINPLSEETHFFKAYFHYMSGEYQLSLEMLNDCLKANEKNIPAHYIKTLCLLKLGQYDEVIQYFDHIPPEVIIQGEKTGAIALAYALKNDTKNTSIYLDQLIKESKAENGFISDSYLFMMYAVMGENDMAFDWVEKAIKNNSSLLLLRYTDPIIIDLKKDSRYLKFFKSIYQTDAASSHKSKNKALLDQKTTANVTTQLLDHIREVKPYLDPYLSLRKLADQMKIHPNQLSWLLNESVGKNYNEFINHYRIENFKSLSKDSGNSNITIMGLAYESGFNSKTVFNTSFKKETGLTPRQFLQQ